MKFTELEQVATLLNALRLDLMKKSKNDYTQMVGDDGFLSLKFIEDCGLDIRIFAGAPSLLELALIKALLASFSEEAVFQLLNDSGELESEKTMRVTSDNLVTFTHEKFAKHGLIKSPCG